MDNQQMYVIAVSCVCLLICYYLYREINKTKVDVGDLKMFSNNLAAFLERPPPEQVEKEKEKEKPNEIVATESKKDD